MSERANSGLNNKLKIMQYSSFMSHKDDPLLQCSWFW